MNERRVTLADIAVRAEVHVTTVSLALRNHPRLPAQTRERIQELAKKMGYVPDPFLRALVAYRGKMMQRRMLLRQIQKRFGQLPPDFEAALDWVEHPHLEELGEALFDLKDLDETRAWILSHQSPEAPR